MSFKGVEIEDEYRSLQDDIVQQFYQPLLKEAIKYQRAVGFFSSSALIEISKGISGLVKNGGRIELIASPKLAEEDVEAIEKGFKLKSEVIEKSLIRSLEEPKTKKEQDRLNLLINLIACDVLEIKIAILEKDNEIGMFHEKMGLLYDSDDNIVAFTGSMNESTTAFMHNYESIDVYCSWEGEKEANRVFKKQMAFKAMWENYEPYVNVIEFPEAARQKLFQYRKTNSIDLELDEEELVEAEELIVEDKVLEPRRPSWFKIRPYQQDAIDNWRDKSYVGIFDMATGTGKTLTGLSAVTDLYMNRKAPLAIFIVCPYQHLVTQWVEDIEAFGMKPVICHSASKQKRWENRLKDECMALEIGIVNHCCAIFTNATFSTERIQKILAPIKNQALLVVDEAHNFGAEHLSKFLDLKIPYRLALSATITRHGDDAGTKKLFDYFGDKCIEYSLKEAIENDMLVRYYYHPIVVSLDEDELIEYLELSKKIAKAIASDKDGEPGEYAKQLMIKRARLIAASRQKVIALIEEMKSHTDENHMLIYCGATTMRDYSADDANPYEEDKRQIDIVVNALGNSLDMKVAKFTSEESASEREQLKKEFDEGERLQTLVAIRCLDEGVNIPSISKAFILASSTNPKEYIQRRGRVLRKYPGKTHSDIYDFIVTPIPLDSVNEYDEETIRLSKSLVKRELERMKDFADLAENPSVADDYIYKMISEFDIDVEMEEELYE